LNICVSQCQIASANESAISRPVIGIGHTSPQRISPEYSPFTTTCTAPSGLVID
jgi:hypothetical protein